MAHVFVWHVASSGICKKCIATVNEEKIVSITAVYLAQHFFMYNVCTPAGFQGGALNHAPPPICVKYDRDSFSHSVHYS